MAWGVAREQKSHPENERHEKKHTKNEDKEENKTPELSRIIQKTAKKQWKEKNKRIIQKLNLSWKILSTKWYRPTTTSSAEWCGCRAHPGASIQYQGDPRDTFLREPRHIFFAENPFHCLQNGKPTFFVNSSKKKIVGAAQICRKTSASFFLQKKSVSCLHSGFDGPCPKPQKSYQNDGFYNKLADTNSAFESTQIDLNAMDCDTKKPLFQMPNPPRLWEHCFERSRELALVVRKMHCWALEGS